MRATAPPPPDGVRTDIGCSPFGPHDPFEHGHKPRTAYAWGEPVTRGLPEDGSHTPKARRTLRLHAPRGFPECRRQPPHARRRRPRPDTAGPVRPPHVNASRSRPPWRSPNIPTVEHPCEYRHSRVRKLGDIDAQVEQTFEIPAEAG